MSQGAKRVLSKRASVWESTFTLPNYTRPQGWSVVEPGKQITSDHEEFQQLVLQILQDEFGGLTLEPGPMEECINFVLECAASGFALSYNRLKRLIGRWITTQYHPGQTEYNEGYRELSYG